MKSIYKQPSIYNGKSIYNGDGVYNGDSLPPVASMTLRFKFSDLTYNPVDAGVGTGGTWNQVKSNPNIWDWTNMNASWSNAFINAFISTSNYVDVIDGSLTGVNNCGSLFNGCKCLTSFEPIDTQDVVQAYSMFANCQSIKKINSLNFENITNAAGMFNGCRILEIVPNIIPVIVYYCGSMFQDCVNIKSGSLDFYNKLISQTTPPPSHTSCFLRCGLDTPTGLAELQQIPSSWGGLAP